MRNIDYFYGASYTLAVLKNIFSFVFAPPSPEGSPGECPACHVPSEIEVSGPIPPRSNVFSISMLALSAAGIRFWGFSPLDSMNNN